jgi:[pyruvate, water dikinase]-phosphate phosphotransferase / [pyruvate, water dikinase] kinase
VQRKHRLWTVLGSDLAMMSDNRAPRSVRRLVFALLPDFVHSPERDAASFASSVGLDRRNARGAGEGCARPIRRRRGGQAFLADGAQRRFTLANAGLRAKLEDMCRAAGLPVLAPLDSLTGTLSSLLGQKQTHRVGAQHALDAAYFARVDAIQFTIAHDDGVGWENWEEADIVLAGVSRTSKTPTSIYLANRGYKTANIPIVVESPPPDLLFRLQKPLVVGLVTSADRLIQIRRNRLLSLNQAPETDYVDTEKVATELAYARRMFADNGWPVIDVTRRSIEEAAAAIINLHNARAEAA